jgi:integrase
VRAAEYGCVLPDDAFIFSSRPDGARPINIDTASSYFRKVADELEMPQYHLHSLRHFAATQLIGHGVDARTAAAQLGHSNPTLTLKTYAHATVERERQAAAIGSLILRDGP